MCISVCVAVTWIWRCVRFDIFLFGVPVIVRCFAVFGRLGGGATFAPFFGRRVEGWLKRIPHASGAHAVGADMGVCYAMCARVPLGDDVSAQMAIGHLGPALCRLVCERHPLVNCRSALLVLGCKRNKKRHKKKRNQFLSCASGCMGSSSACWMAPLNRVHPLELRPP